MSTVLLAIDPVPWFTTVRWPEYVGYTESPTFPTDAARQIIAEATVLLASVEQSIAPQITQSVNPNERDWHRVAERLHESRAQLERATALLDAAARLRNRRLEHGIQLHVR